jgi:hypothetical protein
LSLRVRVDDLSFLELVQNVGSELSAEVIRFFRYGRPDEVRSVRVMRSACSELDPETHPSNHTLLPNTFHPTTTTITERTRMVPSHMYVRIERKET